MNKRKETALELMLGGNLTMEKIARCVKCCRKTLYNWLDDEEFKAEYDRCQEYLSRRTRARLARMTDNALDRMEYILKNGKNDIAAASVAKDILDRAGYTADSNIRITSEAAVQIINDIPK